MFLVINSEVVWVILTGCAKKMNVRAQINGFCKCQRLFIIYSTLCTSAEHTFTSFRTLSTTAYLQIFSAVEWCA